MKPLHYILALALLTPFAATGESARALVESGNQAYEKGKFDDALKAYDQAGTADPNSVEILFDKGAAYYQQKDFDKAKAAFEQAAVKSRDSKLEARCEFNLGTCSFHQAEAKMQEKPKDAVGGLAESVKHFQRASSLDPSFNDAKHNVEVARLAIQALQEVMKQQEQAQEKMKELKEKLEKLLKDQRQLADKTQQSTHPPVPAPPSPLAPDQTAPEAAPMPVPDQNLFNALADEQKQLQQSTQGVSQEMASFVPPPQAQQQTVAPPLRPQEPEAASPVAQARDHVDTATQHQAAAEQQLRETKPTESVAEQGGAAEELKKAIDLLNNSDKQNQDNKDQQDQKDQQGKQDQQDQKDQNKDDQQDQKEGDQQKQDQQKQQDAQQEKDQKDQASQQEGEQQQQEAQAAQQEGENEGEKGDDTAREILNDEKEHKALLLKPAGGYKPVDKDW